MRNHWEQTFVKWHSPCNRNARARKHHCWGVGKKMRLRAHKSPLKRILLWILFCFQVRYVDDDNNVDDDVNRVESLNGSWAENYSRLFIPEELIYTRRRRRTSAHFCLFIYSLQALIIILYSFRWPEKKIISLSAALRQIKNLYDQCNVCLMRSFLGDNFRWGMRKIQHYWLIAGKHIDSKLICCFLINL